MKKIGTDIKKSDLFLMREDFYKNLVRKLSAEKEKIKLGGGENAIQKHKSKGKLTARERISLLIDKDSSFFELNTFAAYGIDRKSVV